MSRILSADYAIVRQAVAQNKLKVCGASGKVFINRRKARIPFWLECSYELVHPPKRPAKPYARICFSVGGIRYRCLVHRVMWFALRGAIPQCMEINHKDGNKLNNRIGNLAICTPSENNAHAVMLGLATPPVPPQRKLTNQQVNELRELAAQGIARKQLAKKFGLDISTVGKIIKHMTYKRVH